MENEELLAKWERGNRALEKLSWETIKCVRNANGRLYPIDWKRVQDKWKGYYPKLDLQSKEEFEEKLKEVCDSLYDWGLYEKCPECKNGIKIPIWSFHGWTAFCGCSNYPECKFSMDRGGESIYG